MASDDKIIEASAKHPKHADQNFQYGTAGVGEIPHSPRDAPRANAELVV